MTEIVTIQMSKVRTHLHPDFTFLDTTVKSNISVYAPTWSMVSKIKKDINCTDLQSEYTQSYYSLMRHRYNHEHDEFMSIFNYDKVAISCFCNPDHFCHRYLLVDILKALADKHNKKFTYLGEVR